MSKKSLMALALAATTENIVKGRGTSGKTTYLDRFVKCLLDENGQPTEPKTRVQITAEISLDIVTEQRLAEQEADSSVPDFSFESEDDLANFKAVNNKVKNQVAAAISNSNNATSLSYNEAYKNVWQIVKDGSTVVLEAIV